MFTVALFKLPRTWKQLRRPSIVEWIKRMWYIHATEYYSAMEKSDTIPFATTRVNLERVILSKVSQTEKEKCHVTSLTRGI